MDGLVITKATVADVPEIHRLITYYADRDDMLHRQAGEIYENLRDYFVARLDGEFLGCAALHVLWRDLAEIRSVAVVEERQARGTGRALVEACVAEARSLGLPRVFALTLRPGFFERLGFRQADVMAFPRKVWNECYRCPKFANCNEVAVYLDRTEGGTPPPRTYEAAFFLTPIPRRPEEPSPDA